MSTPSPTKKCFNCNKPASSRCSKCKGLYFCGRDCQAATWNSHKHLCKAISRHPNATCLLLAGMGPSGPPLFGDETWNDLGEYLLEPVQKTLYNAGVKVVTIDVQKGSKVPEQVGSILSEVETFSSCIAHKWGSGGLPIEYEFLNSKIFRDKIVSWVDSGGRFIVKGSQLRGGNWPAWFGKYWKFDDYYRTDLECNRSHWCKWYYKAKGSIAFAQAKSVLLRGVAPKDNLFNCCNFEDQCAVAVSMYGEGSVSWM